MKNDMTPLVVGSRVHCILYGGNDGVIFAIHGRQSPGTVQTLGGGVCVTGGGADFDIVWENGGESLRTPECLIRGSVQWHILYGIASPEVIEFMREFATAEEVKRKAEASAAKDKFSADCLTLRSNPLYSHLEQTTEGGHFSCGKLVASNLRKEFKKAFPGIKFSVRKEHYGAVNIGWTDGPTIAEVEAISDKYSGGHFDGMEDLYTYTSSPFTSVFGSAQYIFTNRDHSFEALKEAVREVCMGYGWELLKVEQSNLGRAFLPCDNSDHYRKVFDLLEKRYEYENREGAVA